VAFDAGIRNTCLIAVDANVSQCMMALLRSMDNCEAKAALLYYPHPVKPCMFKELVEGYFPIHIRNLRHENLLQMAIIVRKSTGVLELLFSPHTSAEDGKSCVFQPFTVQLDDYLICLPVHKVHQINLRGFFLVAGLIYANTIEPTYKDVLWL
jgi:hypothetical protein